MSKHTNGTSRLTFVAKVRRGHVQVFDGRRLRYLVTGYCVGPDVPAARRIETLYGPFPQGRDYLRLLSKADAAHDAAEIEAANARRAA